MTPFYPPTVVAVIPVYGRHGLIQTTIRRLKHYCGVAQVVCVVSNPQDEGICRLAGADTVRYPNNLLGDKWNAGFRFAQGKYDPDYYLYVGSGDWLSHHWVMCGIKAMRSMGWDMTGRKDFYLIDYGERGERRMCYWPGYKDPDRKGEPIGIGRILSRHALELMKGEPFFPDQDSSLDYVMWQKVRAHGLEIGMIPDKVKALSVSCYKWGNKHNFESHWQGNEPGHRVDNPDRWLKRHFPDVKDFAL